MRALTYEGPHEIAVSTVADPVPHDLDGAVVAVRAAGICGSDLHIYGGHGFSTDLGFCVGHEAVGEVVEVGSGVRSFAVGDRVVVPASTGCGTCSACRSGWVLGCRRQQSGCYGLGHALEGSQAEAVAVPAADGNLVRVPDAIGDDAALTLTDNLPTAWYGARRGRIQPGETVAVIGLGPVGILSILSAQVFGAARVLAVDLVAERRAQAAALGAEPMEGDDVKAAVAEATAGRGADVVIEAVGADATIDLATKLAGQRGRVSVVGVNQNRALPLHVPLAQIKELELAIGLCSVQAELPTLLPLVASGRLRPEVAVTHHLPLSEGPEAYRLFAEREAGIGKVVLDPSR
ncbi:alcohol dehydrogenase catalytic domain-containing protein [Aquihabitans sp. G128]|uniref:alcohol dehydrogenase family protein n=1 Tax=Aquihabitans sp. G128 TaxID=2849779 RepID=UPI001C2239C4|nr:alcohol dehydrogenase family protein [Aquihabitans sp. G128]QXC61050.1 alcohol dehydrogenase catalytic domain-containing protein [Aquihabitans sp. G128]